MQKTGIRQTKRSEWGYKVKGRGKRLRIAVSIKDLKAIKDFCLKTLKAKKQTNKKTDKNKNILWLTQKN